MDRSIRIFCLCLALAAFATAALATTYNVSTVGQLNSAVGNARSGDHIVIAPGTYNLTSGLQMNYVGVTIRGATGNFDDVILVGGGMNARGVDEGILVNTDNITVRDLTLKDFYYNAVHIRGENDADNAVISNVKTWNIGERHIKGSGGGVPSAVSDNVLIEGVYMLQTIDRAGHPDTGDDYIGGIDCMGVRNWTIRDSLAVGIHGELNGGNAAIFLWQGVQGVTIENNVFIGNAKGIALGNPSGPSSGIFTYPYHAVDVTIRNNAVLRGTWTTGNNIALELCNVSNVDVMNNTLYSENASYFRTLSVQDETGEGQTTDLVISGNIIRGGVFDLSSGDWSATAVRNMGNIVDTNGATILPGWFVDPANGDFHLTEAALAAIDGASWLAQVLYDFDGQLRGIAPDFGADEFRFVGDLNGDNVVDVGDLAVLAGNYRTNAGASWEDGDLNGDGAVDVADLSLMAGSYRAAHGGNGQLVPEPATMALLAAGGAFWLSRRRRMFRKPIEDSRLRTTI